MVERKLCLLLAIALVLRLIFAFLFPLPAYGDEMWHYLLSESFTQEKWLSTPYIDGYWGHVEVPQGTSYRPPLFNFMVGGALMLFGGSFFLMQMLNVLIGTAVVYVVYLVGKGLFDAGGNRRFDGFCRQILTLKRQRFPIGDDWRRSLRDLPEGQAEVSKTRPIDDGVVKTCPKDKRKVVQTDVRRAHAEKTALAASLFTAINPVFISLSIGGEVRMFFALLFLVSIYFWISGKRGWAGIFCGLSILAHQMGIALAIGYGILMLTDAMKERRVRVSWLKETAIFFAPSLLALLILLAINFALFADAFYSTSKYVPIITSWSEMQKLAPPSLENFDWGAGISNTWQNIVRTFLPLPFSRVADDVRLDFNFITNTNLNYNSLASITTLVLLAAAIVYAYERKKWTGLLACMFAGGLLLAVLSSHWPAAYTYSFLFGASFLVIIFGMGRILEEKGRRRNLLVALVFLLLLFQFVVFLNRPAEKPSVIEWVENNIAQDERIMSGDCLEIAFYTKKTCFVKPSENEETVRNTASKYGVDYFVQRKKDGESPYYSLAFENEDWLVYRSNFD